MCLGGVAADRRVKVNRFILKVDGETDVHYPSHDFSGGYKFFICGILHTQVLNYSSINDNYGNGRLVPLDVRNTLYGNNKFRGENRKMTMLEHFDDLSHFMEEQFRGNPPANCLLTTDHGGDANFKTPKALLIFGRIFRKYRLGVLHITGPASNDSKTNRIERCWAGPKKQMAGMMLPEAIHGDSVPPDQQGDIKNDLDKLGKKELELYVLAGESVKLALDELNGRCQYKTRYSLPEV
jgi:hypothetical protein